ncbi:hypothetical protein SeMB42_g04469 [Synchytrium endobioticum]|uniref:Uncharacterized protein n=1 Tax=Synchytrium endobioticum TaxID=286115 RepID=A0A507CXX4_9FUNG|nr:hypothetical protein SeMB42_g04469 [Synchytrium endobioticum]
MAGDVPGDVFIDLLSDHIRKYRAPDHHRHAAQLQTPILVLDPHQLSYIVHRLHDAAHHSSASSTSDPTSTSFWSLASLLGSNTATSSGQSDTVANLAFIDDYIQTNLKELHISPHSPSVPNRIQQSHHAAPLSLSLHQFKSLKALNLNQVRLELLRLPEDTSNLASLSAQNSVPDCDSFVNTLTANQSEPIPSLTQLDLSHNELNELKPKLINVLPGIRKLDLSNNSFQEIPKVLENLVSLNELSLANNRISEVIGVDLLLPRLIRLNLSGNKLESVNGLEQCERLWSLDVSSNNIHQVVDINRIGTLELEELTVAKNPLTQNSQYRTLIFSYFKAVRLTLDGSLPTRSERRAIEATITVQVAPRVDEELDMRSMSGTSSDGSKRKKKRVVTMDASVRHESQPSIASRLDTLNSNISEFKTSVLETSDESMTVVTEPDTPQSRTSMDSTYFLTPEDGAAPNLDIQQQLQQRPPRVLQSPTVGPSVIPKRMSRAFELDNAAKTFDFSGSDIITQRRYTRDPNLMKSRPETRRPASTTMSASPPDMSSMNYFARTGAKSKAAAPYAGNDEQVTVTSTDDFSGVNSSAKEFNEEKMVLSSLQTPVELPSQDQNVVAASPLPSFSAENHTTTPVAFSETPTKNAYTIGPYRRVFDSVSSAGSDSSTASTARILYEDGMTAAPSRRSVTSRSMKQSSYSASNKTYSSIPPDVESGKASQFEGVHSQTPASLPPLTFYSNDHNGVHNGPSLDGVCTSTVSITSTSPPKQDSPTKTHATIVLSRPTGWSCSRSQCSRSSVASRSCFRQTVETGRIIMSPERPLSNSLQLHIQLHLLDDDEQIIAWVSAGSLIVQLAPYMTDASWSKDLNYGTEFEGVYVLVTSKAFYILAPATNSSSHADQQVRYDNPVQFEMLYRVPFTDVARLDAGIGLQYFGLHFNFSPLVPRQKAFRYTPVPHHKQAPIVSIVLVTGDALVTRDLIQAIKRHVGERVNESIDWVDVSPLMLRRGRKDFGSLKKPRRRIASKSWLPISLRGDAIDAFEDVLEIDDDEEDAVAVAGAADVSSPGRNKSDFQSYLPKRLELFLICGLMLPQSEDVFDISLMATLDESLASMNILRNDKGLVADVISPFERLIGATSLKSITRIERCTSSVNCTSHCNRKWRWLYRISLTRQSQKVQWNVLMPTRNSMDLFERHIRRHFNVVEDEDEDIVMSQASSASQEAKKATVVLRVMDD